MALGWRKDDYKDVPYYMLGQSEEYERLSRQERLEILVVLQAESEQKKGAKN